MRRCLSTILILFACLLTCSARIEPADSIISRMHKYGGIYANAISEYNADLYVKAQLDIIRRNRGFRYIPGLFRAESDVNRYILETYSDVHFTAPHIYDQKIRAMSGTLPDVRNIPDVQNFFNINVYSPYLVGRQLLSPLAPNSHRYYRYAVDSISVDSCGRMEFHIGFIPRNKSFQLLEGRMVITDGVWSVRRIRFRGRSELLHFECNIEMGLPGTPTEYLPCEYDIYATFRFALNEVEGYYNASVNYSGIVPSSPETVARQKKNYNLSASFSLSCDGSSYSRDYGFFDSIRNEPLTLSEKEIYHSYGRRLREKELRLYNDSLRADSLKAAYLRADSLRGDSLCAYPVSKPRFNTKKMWNVLGDFFIDDYRWNIANANLNCSPIMNPLLFSYSRSNGISYRQDLRFNAPVNSRQNIDIGARLGYNFKHNEFYWNVNGSYNYMPSHMGSLRFSVGNGNRIYNSNIIDELKSIPVDSTINFDRLNLTLFTDFNIELRNHIEIVNGLSLDAGMIYHRRTPIYSPEPLVSPGTRLPDQIEEGLHKLHRRYISFAPRVRLSWTPGQYYYLNGGHKTNLNSRYPTMIADFERGIKGIFGSTGRYERVEFDLQHSIRLGLLNHLYYRVGCGFFTNQEEDYFVDFVNFRNSNLPRGWSDEIGGVFQALDGTWYNASPYYIRAHVTYEAPFLLMRHLIRYTAHVQNERLYLNLLGMERLGPYFEVGYGIGTFVFDLGLFVSLEKFSKVGFGSKITFELFN